MVSILAFTGVIYAIIDFYTKKKDAKRHALLTLYHALNIFAHWSSYEKGGYATKDSDRIVKENAKEWRNPFWGVFEIDNSSLQNIWPNPGITLLPDETIEQIASLNQEVANFNSTVKAINGFRSSIAPILAIDIHLKLNGVRKQRLTTEEEFICTKLQELYWNLHFIQIGNNESSRLYQKHKELFDNVKRALKRW